MPDLDPIDDLAIYLVGGPLLGALLIAVAAIVWTWRGRGHRSRPDDGAGEPEADSDPAGLPGSA